MPRNDTVSSTLRTQGRAPAETAARSLSNLLRNSTARQLLLRPPPTLPMAAEQASVLRSIGTALHNLRMALPDTPNARTLGQVLNALLDHQAAKSVGALAAWVQQQPQQLASALQLLLDQDSAAQQQGRAGSIFQILEQNLLGTVQLPFSGSVWSISSWIIHWMLKAVCNSGLDYSSPATGSIGLRMSEQLDASGFTAATTLQPLLQQIMHMPPSHAGWAPGALTLHNVRQLLCMWDNLVVSTPALQQFAVRGTLPLLQQLQGSSKLLSSSTPAAAAHAAIAESVWAGASRLSGGQTLDLGCACVKADQTFVHAQLAAVALLYRLGMFNNTGKLQRAAVAPFKQLLKGPAVSELLLQVLTVLTAALHQEHMSEIQQHLASDSSSSSSSSSSGRVDTALQNQQQQKQLRADLLPIPAFHQDMAPLLPGGKGYLLTAAETLAGLHGTLADKRRALRKMAVEVVTTLQFSLMQIVHSAAGSSSSGTSSSSSNRTLDSVAALLSPAGVRLLLEMQLLAAGKVQRQQRLRMKQRTQQKQQRQQQQQQQQQEKEDVDSMDACERGDSLQSILLIRSSAVLSIVIKTAVRGGRTSLAPEVLQQAGLQLLQALAAPMQQRQLSKAAGAFACETEELLDGQSGDLYTAVLNTQYTLRAACCGLGSSSMPPFTGQLLSLAAAHPEAYATYMDCCIRSSVLRPVDMLAVSDLLEEACKAAVGCRGAGGMLDNAAAVAALSSAVASFAKRTAQFTKAAVGLQRPQRLRAPAAGSGTFLSTTELAATAAACFPAAVPSVFALLKTMAGVLLAMWMPASSNGSLLAMLRAVTGTAASNSSSSSSSSSGSLLAMLQAVTGTPASSSSSSKTQACASSALLAVLIIRSAVQLADAMEAAGPQLLYQSKSVQPAFFQGQNSALNEFDSHMAGVLGMTGDAQQQQSVAGQWQLWQQCVLVASKGSLGTLKVLGAVPQLGGGAMADGDAASSSNSSSGQQVKGGHLLQLQSSKQLAAAVTTFEAKWPDWFSNSAQYQSSCTPAAVARTAAMYADILQLCRAVAAAAPLLGVCNYLGCENLAGVSEAAAASKTCTACKCSYCSVACQKADWPLHKHACKRMSAAGEQCW